MNVRNTLKILGKKIEDVFPKMEDVSPNSEDANLSANIADIQHHLAEIYGIIQRETANDDLNICYDAAENFYPERIESITNLISSIALILKTKLNWLEGTFNHDQLKKIDKVCFDCYKIKFSLSSSTDDEIYEEYKHGLVSPMEYIDYETNFKNMMLPHNGGILSIVPSSNEICTQYLSTINKIREYLASCKISNKNEEVINLKSLQQLSAQVLKQHRQRFFQQLTLLNESITSEYPELDVNYRHKFCSQVTKIVNGITFKPNENEKKYLDKILAALKDTNPYNSIHVILVEIDQINKTAYMSIFKDRMQPIRNEIVYLMETYNNDKQEYVKHFGKSL